MKKLLILCCALTVLACQKKEEAPRDYVTLSGTITDKTSDSIQIVHRTFKKTIMVNADGTFKDTLKVEPGLYNFIDFNEGTPIFLKNGYDLNVTVDAKNFDESLKYSGHGAESNNFLAERSIVEKRLFMDMEAINESNFDEKFNNFKTKLSEFYNSNPKVDTMIINGINKEFEPMIKSYENYFSSKVAFKKEFPTGKVSPRFENYENYKGGTTSLSDLKGSYVYIDVWATWCGPCIAEIPSLKKVEHDYEGKNIKFVSISIDDARRSGGGSLDIAKDKWKTMIADKQLGGMQLFADNDWNSEFIKNYKINGIPRFILIDPNGNIVDADAPRPSSESLIALFNELKI